MMTTDQLRQWIATFRRLRSEMLDNGDPQSLMVSGAMCSIEAHLASCAEGDDRGLRALFDFTGQQAREFIAEAVAQDAAGAN